MTSGIAPKWADLPVRHLVLETDDFIVFLDPDLDVDWKTSPEWDAKGAQKEPRHNGILNEVARLEASPCDGLPKATILHYRRLLAEAVARSLSHDYQNADQVLASAQAYLTARQEEVSRFWYLSSSAGMAAPLVLAGLAIWIWRAEVEKSLGLALVHLALASTAGVSGALLSVIARMGRLSVGCSAGRAVHVLEGCSRIWAGAISGLIAALAFRAELVFGNLSSGSHSFSVMLLLALAAGVSERWIPMILSHLERDLGAARKSRGSEEQK